MYKYIAPTALVLGSAALGFNINRGDGEQFTVGLIEDHGNDSGEVTINTRSFIIDLDLDGFDDIVQVTTTAWEFPPPPPEYVELRAKMNQGDMSFTSWELIGTYDIDPLPGISGNLDVSQAHLMNVNADLYPDLVFTVTEEYGDIWDEVSGHVTVYLINNGSGGFTCAGDVTDDGRTNVDDLLGVIADWGCIEEGQPD